MKNIKRKNILTYKQNIERRNFLFRFSIMLFILFFSLFFVIYKNTENIIFSTKADILQNKVNYQTPKTIYQAYGNFNIIDIKTKKLKDIYTEGDNIEFTIITTGDHGIIKIFTLNNNIKFEKNYILPEKGKNIYKIYGKAIKPGREFVSFIDGINTKIIEVGILPKGDNIYGLMIAGPKKLLLNEKVTYKLFFINILGYKAEKSLKGNIKIYILKNGKILDQDILYIKDDVYQQPLDFEIYEKGKFELAIEFTKGKRKYFSLKHIEVN